jgi:UDP-2,3-diacylglucosamine hydrolase
MIHGDGLSPSDRGYRILKKILRNRFNIWLYRKIPPDWGIPLAKYVSSSSRGYTAGREPKFIKDYEMYAEKKIAEGNDIVVIGHLHLPILKEMKGGVYLNTGDFIDHFSYGRLENGNLTLEYV